MKEEPIYRGSWTDQVKGKIPVKPKEKWAYYFGFSIIWIILVLWI